MQITELSYLRPDTVEQAVEALGAWGGGAVPLAGGMSLLPDMHLGLKRPRAVVSLARLARLADVYDDARHLRVGAMVTHRRLASDPLVLRRAPALAEAAAGLADVQVRNRGTVGGSLANAHPGAEAATVLAALGAHVELTGSQGPSVIGVAEFVLGAGHVATTADELVVAIIVPHPGSGTRAAYLRCSRIQGNYSTVNAAAVLTDDGGRVAIGGATPRPVVVELPRPLRHRGDELALTELVAAAVSACAEAIDDHMASAEYRQALAGVLARRVAIATLDRDPSGTA